MIRSRAAGVLTVAGSLVLMLSLLGFLGPLTWWFDLLANFKLQFLLGLAVIGAALMTLGRTGTAAVMLGGAMLNIAVIAPLYYRSPADPQPDAPEITVVGYNIQIGNRVPRLGWALDGDPDVVFLFETGRAHLADLEERFPDHHVRSGIYEGRNYGVTILTTVDVEVELLEFARAAGDAVRLELAFGDGTVVVYGVHPPSPTNAADTAYRDDVLARVGRAVAEETDPVIVVGDLNATPWSNGFRNLTGPGDLVNSLEGFGYGASWPTRLPAIARIPIDHVLHTRQLTVISRQLGPATEASDHRPVRVRLTMAASPGIAQDRSSSPTAPDAVDSHEAFTMALRRLYPGGRMLGPMSESTALIGTKVSARRRRPKAVDGVRICSARSCTTRLSRYNRNGTCHMHSPITFPRVRGRDVPVIDV
ncbi:MAG: endonuclease/exonuclease/phosphatase family protein [Acidimicrobiia bacterium]